MAKALKMAAILLSTPVQKVFSLILMKKNMITKECKKAPITTLVGGMALNNALTSWTGMLHKSSKPNMLKNFSAAVFLTLFVTSCVASDHSGFYNPITLSTVVPDGPPEYKAGWYAGCKTGSSMKSFANNWVMQKPNGPDFGSGVYAHDPIYQTGWGQGYNVCVNYIAEFVNRPAMQHQPLE